LITGDSVRVRFPPPRCRDDSVCPASATDHQRGEAGAEGGTPERDRLSRRAQLDTERNTNPRVNRRQLEQAYSRYQAWSKTDKARGRAMCKRPGCTPAETRRRVGSYLQHNTDLRNDGTRRALSSAQTVGRREGVRRTPRREGSPKKPTSRGKPADMLTWGRCLGRNGCR
jgi:hypothetical protein